jgi:hypothetical protein
MPRHRHARWRRGHGVMRRERWPRGDEHNSMVCVGLAVMMFEFGSVIEIWQSKFAASPYARGFSMGKGGCRE